MNNNLLTLSVADRNLGHSLLSGISNMESMPTIVVTYEQSRV